MRRLARSVMLIVLSAGPAAAETLTAHQAAERVGRYFTLSAMAAAVAAECANVAAGTITTKTGMTLSWQGPRDYRDAQEQAARYASAQNQLFQKIVAVTPAAGPELETGIANLGGRAGLVAKYRAIMQQDPDRSGPVGICAIMKYGIDSNALPISPDLVVIP